jgi:hypothetical protein
LQGGRHRKNTGRVGVGMSWNQFSPGHGASKSGAVPVEGLPCGGAWQGSV